jgi:pSer/pThr/pTyr-binding forkhead associated (FHA) protein
MTRHGLSRTIGHRAPSGEDRGVARRLLGRLVSVRPDGRDDRVYRLEQEQVDIGRSAGGIQIEDPQLASRHARLSLTAAGGFLTALDARNGVYVRLRDPSEVGDGDHILVGRQVLRFEVVPEHERRAAVAIEDGVALFGTPSPPAWGRLRQLMASGGGRDIYHLARNEVTLGRERSDLVFPDDEFLSRRHARLFLRAGRPTLEDLTSSNGTYLRIRAPHPLVSGDMLRLGDQLLRFELG